MKCNLLQKPERDEWGSGLEALECALQLEKSVNQSLLDLHKVASEHGDPHVRLQHIPSHSHTVLNSSVRLGEYRSCAIHVMEHLHLVI